MWLRNKATGGEFYVTNAAHQRRLLADPNYEVFEPTKKGKKVKAPRSGPSPSLPVSDERGGVDPLPAPFSG